MADTGPVDDEFDRWVEKVVRAFWTDAGWSLGGGGSD